VLLRSSEGVAKCREVLKGGGVVLVIDLGSTRKAAAAVQVGSRGIVSVKVARIDNQKEITSLPNAFFVLDEKGLFGGLPFPDDIGRWSRGHAERFIQMVANTNIRSVDNGGYRVAGLMSKLVPSGSAVRRFEA
jgi:hypothetical protein